MSIEAAPSSEEESDCGGSDEATFGTWENWWWKSGAEGINFQGSRSVLNAHREIILEPSESPWTLFPSSPISNLWSLYPHLPGEEIELVWDMPTLT